MKRLLGYVETIQLILGVTDKNLATILSKFSQLYNRIKFIHHSFLSVDVTWLHIV